MHLGGVDDRERDVRQLNRAWLAVGAVAALVACVVACSDSALGFSSAGAFGGSVGSAGPPLPPPTSGGPTGSASCEGTPPKQNAPCMLPGVCEYGGAIDPACNVIATCRAYSWDVVQPAHCPTTCPEKFDERAPGTTCSDPDVCTYLEATCGCAGAIVPHSDAPTNVDGGADDGGADGGGADDGGDAAADGGPPRIGAWQCIRPGNGCPARRPVLGATCTKDMICDYGTCVFGVPLTLQCSGNEWVAVEGPSCP